VSSDDVTMDEPMDGDDPMVAGIGMEISALASDQVVHASAMTSVREAAAIMDSEGIGLLILVDEGGGIEGVLSERDILKAVAAGNDLDAAAATVSHGHEIQRATPTSTVGEVAKEMMENYVRHVVITGPKGELTGIVSVRDLLSVIVN